MNDMLKAKPWIEPGLYVECPYCGNCHLIESDVSVSMPAEDEVWRCVSCKKNFVIVGGDEP